MVPEGTITDGGLFNGVALKLSPEHIVNVLSDITGNGLTVINTVSVLIQFVGRLLSVTVTIYVYVTGLDVEFVVINVGLEIIVELNPVVGDHE